MEPLAALGVAASIVQLSDVGYRTTMTMIEVYRSADGLTTQNADLEAAATELKELCVHLKQGVAAAGSNASLSRLLKKSIDVSDSVLKELASLKFSGGLSYLSDRLARLVIAIRAIRRKRKVEDLHLRVIEIRQQLFMLLQGLILDQRCAMADSLDGLHSAAKNIQKSQSAHAAGFDGMCREFEKLVAAHSSWSDSQDAIQDFTKRFVAFVDQIRNSEVIANILRSLHFEQLRMRQSEIPVAHQKTFEWMFNADGGEDFRIWLSGPKGGIFWITGKPGSGKSTLMKFLLGHPKTAELLEQWRDDKRPLLRVSHFFWAVGDRLQKSHEGLLRTLLFQILMAYPELIPAVCPERYSTPYRCLESWTVDELSASFERLTQVARLPARIFILVDGLDEYDGEPTDIARIMKRMASCRGIKVCCASRPWIQFETAFKSAEGRIRIHDLTKEDVRLYVHDCFEADEHYQALRSGNPIEAQRLVNSVISRAEGVFFWVYLVVKSLLRGLECDDDMAILHRRFEELPTDLDAFFKKILQSVDPVYAGETAVALDCLLMANSSLPVIVFTAMDLLDHLWTSLKRKGFWVDQLLSQPSGHRRMQQKPSSPGAPKTGQERFNQSQALALYPVFRDSENQLKYPWELTAFNIKKIENRLLHHCQDLVQCWDSGAASPTTRRVGFIHRTVVDFLRTPDAASILSRPYPPEYPSFLLARSFIQVAEWCYQQSPETFRDSIRWVITLVTRHSTPRLNLILGKLDFFLDWISLEWIELLQPTQGRPALRMVTPPWRFRRLTDLPRAYILAPVVPRLGLTQYLAILSNSSIPDSLWYYVFLQALQPVLRLAPADDAEYEGFQPRDIDLEALEYLVNVGASKIRTGMICFYPGKDFYEMIRALNSESLPDGASQEAFEDSRRTRAVLIFLCSLSSTSNFIDRVPQPETRSPWEFLLRSVEVGHVTAESGFAACKLLLSCLPLINGGEQHFHDVPWFGEYAWEAAMAPTVVRARKGGKCELADIVLFFERKFGQRRAQVLTEILESIRDKRVTGESLASEGVNV